MTIIENIAAPGTLPLASIQPSPTNPRKTFDPEKLKHLAETIRAQGFLQKLLVRPWPGKPNVFELVDGERRWRAAKQLGIDVLPVDVRPLTDAQVIEIQLIAGETGEPLTPIEEGEGFKTALAMKDTASGIPIYTLRSLAEKLGCGFTHVRQRVELTRLPGNVREWVASGSLAPRTANLLARIPDAQAMKKAIQDIVFPKHREDPLPYKEAEAVIHERYMVSLRSAPFDVNDATFDGPMFDETNKRSIPLACASCPLKTGNDSEKFGDMKDKNVCTNPTCYRAKCNAAWARAAVKAKAAGQRVLTDEEAAEVFEKNSPTVQIAYSSPYADVDSKPTYRHVPNDVEDKNLPTWRELLATAAEKKGIKVPIVLARDRTGKQWQLVQVTLCIEAARAIGEDMFKKTPANESMTSGARFERDAVRSTVRGTDDFAQKKKAEADATKKRMAECLLGLDALYRFLCPQIVFSNGTWGNLLHTALHHAGNDGQALVIKWLKLKTTGGEFEKTDAIEAWFKKTLPDFDRRHAHAIVPILLIAQSLRWNGLKCEGFLALIDKSGIDVKALEKQASSQVGATEKPAKKAKHASTPEPTSAARPKGRELQPEELKELAERYAGKPVGDIAFRFGISAGLAKWYVANAGQPAATNFGLTEGKYIAVKTLLTAGKPHSKVAEQLGISVGQVEGVAEREEIEPKKRDAGKAAVAAVRGSVTLSTRSGRAKPAKTKRANKGGAK